MYRGEIMKAILVSALLLSGCNLNSRAEAPEPMDFNWLTGCWQNLDGATREVWSGSEDGYFFGYAVTYNQGRAVFFEQMRIDPGETPTFQAYPRGKGPSGFPAIELSATHVTFANPAHDYPQKITYTRRGETLNAVISLIDDTRQGDFNFIACAAD